MEFCFFGSSVSSSSPVRNDECVVSKLLKRRQPLGSGRPWQIFELGPVPALPGLSPHRSEIRDSHGLKTANGWGHPVRIASDPCPAPLSASRLLYNQRSEERRVGKECRSLSGV